MENADVGKHCLLLNKLGFPRWRYKYSIWVKKVSFPFGQACKSMCMWVRAMDQYSHVYRTVEPKRQK